MKFRTKCDFRRLLVFIMAIRSSLQRCPEEITKMGISVKWHESDTATDVVSDPPCYHMNYLVTRNCNSTGWIPSLRELKPCMTVVEYYDLSSCPPGYHKVSPTSNTYCYQIGEPSAWNYPCLKNGGASVITDLSEEEYKSLLTSIKEANISRYFWLPAQRQRLFSPVVWYIPGPNWGRSLEKEEFRKFPLILKNCLIIDIEEGRIYPETCNKQYPNLCIYLNDLQYPATCPNGYHGFRFLPDDGTCLGIEQSEDTSGLTFNDFLNKKCKKLIGDSEYGDITRFIFKKISQLNNLDDNIWCWFSTMEERFNFSSQEYYNNSITLPNFPSFQGVINNNGALGLMDSENKLPCMACETEMIYYGDTALHLEYNHEENNLHLTVYFPSGLWKYDENDTGFQCFSDAKGFTKPIEIIGSPLTKVDDLLEYSENNFTVKVEKAVYAIDLVTQRTAQYWCEGHNKTFGLLTTNKIIANPKGNTLHVFALVIKVNFVNGSFVDLVILTVNLTKIFNAEKVLVMDVFEYMETHVLALMHLHVGITNKFEDESSNLVSTYQSLVNTAQAELAAYNIKFVNLSSSVYCLPTTSRDYMILEWELTPIGHIASPGQFCLQNNGLPVRRSCHGSYNLGGIWGEVEGKCNKTYEPTTTTTFLYNFLKGQYSTNLTSRFLIEGLSFVLEDLDIIIPADIYYLAMSLRHVINVAQKNESFVDMGDVDNIAWAMDRILLLDYDYMRLAQTFNSTNVILDSFNDIFDKLAKTHNNSTRRYPNDLYYQLAVQPQFIVQISYPLFNNVTGIAIIRQSESCNFTDMLIQPLYQNSTIDDVLESENLEVAAWIPDVVLNTLEKTINNSYNYTEPSDKSNIYVVVSIFYNDTVFQQLDSSRYRTNSRIVGISVPGYITDLANPIPILFKEDHRSNYKEACGFWDFQTKNSDSNPGFWSNRGCFFEKSVNNVTVCQCYHMTHFGQLLDMTELRKPSDLPTRRVHLRALNVITLVGSFLSLFGIIGIFITALVFQTWRKKPGTKVLLQLSTAIALPLLLMVVFNLDNSFFVEKDGLIVINESKKIMCIVLGSLLQYSILASFTWMLITAILQFVRYVRVLGVCRPTRFMCKLAVMGWGIPLVPVALVLAIDYENFIPKPSTDHGKRICYPTGFFFIVGVLLPIIIVLIINVTLFIIVLYSISKGPGGKVRSTDMDLVGAQLRLSLFLFFLLGLTWIFGVFSFTTNLLWSYLFCLTSTLQGFVLFIYFVVCDPATRGMWITLMKPQFLSTSPRKSLTSISSS